MRSDPTLLKWYHKINKRFFDGACPNNVCVKWADADNEMQWEDKYFGIADRSSDTCHDYVIVMSRPLNKRWITRISTLVHEMIHLATGLRDNHGEAFERWREHISERGIFKKHALRKGSTLF